LDERLEIEPLEPLLGRRDLQETRRQVRREDRRDGEVEGGERLKGERG
jgi:hypothetical protein